MMFAVRKTVLIILMFSLLGSASGQTRFSSKNSKQLVEDLLPRNSFGITIVSTRLRAHPESVASFVSSAEKLPIKAGIIMTTGVVTWAGYPNDSGSSGCAMFTSGDSRLEKIAGARTSDAAILEIEFVANTDEVSFEYFFASEEYPEYVNKGVNDVFAFFIEGPGYDTLCNIAKLPTTGEPITVDHVNAQQNSEFYIENKSWRGYSIDNPGSSLASIFQFDGMTTLLEAKAKIRPYATYKLTLAIADVGDNIYDSGVFIKAHSLKSAGKLQPVAPYLKSEIEKRMHLIGASRIRVNNDTVGFDKTIHFDFNSYDILSEDTTSLNEIADLLAQFFDARLKLIGHTDDVGSDEYNMDLSRLRARSVANYLNIRGVDDSRIITEGRGKRQPITRLQTDKARRKNRRVEFLIYKK
ncbi:MAG: OmpA family protein [Salinivirgaceae bacterium]|nr:OmpA family protein [Salinivirgaceae bacterium]